MPNDEAYTGVPPIDHDVAKTPPGYDYKRLIDTDIHDLLFDLYDVSEDLCSLSYGEESHINASKLLKNKVELLREKLAEKQRKKQ